MASHAQVARAGNAFRPPARRISPSRPAHEYWGLWERTGDPSALLAWGDAIARDRAASPLTPSDAPSKVSA